MATYENRLFRIHRLDTDMVLNQSRDLNWALEAAVYYTTYEGTTHRDVNLWIEDWTFIHDADTHRVLEREHHGDIGFVRDGQFFLVVAA